MQLTTKTLNMVLKRLDILSNNEQPSDEAAVGVQYAVNKIRDFFDLPELVYFCASCGTPHYSDKTFSCCDFDDRDGNINAAESFIPRKERLEQEVRENQPSDYSKEEDIPEPSERPIPQEMETAPEQYEDDVENLRNAELDEDHNAEINAAAESREDEVNQE